MKGEYNMFFVNLITGLATTIASIGSQACFFGLIDEPECPKNLIK